MKNKKKRKRGRIFLYTSSIFVSVFLLSILGLYIACLAQIDSDADQRMFDALGTTQSTRIYVNKHQEGLAYEPLEYDVVFGNENMVLAKSEEIPQMLKDAFVAIEDHRFFSHKGVDVMRTGKAAINYLLRFDKHFGGSTITQQLIKNVLDEKDVTVKRKM